MTQYAALARDDELLEEERAPALE
eukprot:COSAG01_NODE_54529_length_331_cov_1.112069_2_plen_23_part_01